MRQSQLFPKTRREPPKGAESVNHKLLVQAGFIDQLMTGSWTLLPMGQKVVTKVSNIIREELGNISCQEILMPLLHPKSIWNETGRWDSASEVMYQLKDARNKDYALSFTHEEIFLDLSRKYINSYMDLPLALYHFSTKFRQELRAKSGILRGREFLMKDLYSLHEDGEDFSNFYEQVKEAYANSFKRMGFEFKITEAGGGVFTDNITHEFQVLADGGEDLVYFCEGCEWAVNKEMFDDDSVKNPLPETAKKVCPECGGRVKSARSIEVGNIFSFGTYYSEKMGIKVTDKNGRKIYPYFGSYGIGTTRVMGTWVEVSHDARGIIWNEAISPFGVHLVELPGGKGEEIYGKLRGEGIDVLWDDRGVSAGEKFADADLIGIPVRMVSSAKTGTKIEVKARGSGKVETLTVSEWLRKRK